MTIFTDNAIENAFNEAKEHAIEVYSDYPLLVNDLKNTEVEIEYNSNTTALAWTEYLSDALIHIYMNNIEKDMAISSEEDIYNIFLHEFSHVIKEQLYSSGASHGREFKEVAKSLGLKHAGARFRPANGILYTLLVPVDYDASRGIRKRQYYYVSEQWLNEHPDYRQYIVKTATEK